MNRNESLQPSRALWRWLPLLALLLASLACQVSLGGPQAPADRTPVPAQAQDWRSLLANAQPGDTLDITLTEGDLTAILARQVGSVQDVKISDPQVVLRNGKMEVYGRAEAPNVAGNFQAVLNVQAENGRARVDVESANIGAIPVPSSITERMTSALDDTLADATGSGGRLYINRIDMLEGAMTINATVQ